MREYNNIVSDWDGGGRPRPTACFQILGPEEEAARRVRITVSEALGQRRGAPKINLTLGRDVLERNSPGSSVRVCFFDRLIIGRSSSRSAARSAVLALSFVRTCSLCLLLLFRRVPWLLQQASLP